MDASLLTREWLEADGLGGFASGTAAGVRTRRYHALLLTATLPPAGRMALANGLDAWIEAGGKSHPLSCQAYAPEVYDLRAAESLEGFASEPWPRWTYAPAGNLRVEYSLFVPHGTSSVVLSWQFAGTPPADTRLFVRPFFSGRDFHALHRENPAFNFHADPMAGGWRWAPYPGVPGILAKTNAAYRHDPQWYRRFFYAEEAARGLDSVEDLASPGVFAFDPRAGKAVLILAAEGFAPEAADSMESAASLEARLARKEAARRAAFPSPLHRAADAYLVRRGAGQTLIAGYPWFGDWGRDTFIALRGLCLATGRLQEARDILVEWAGAVSEGMLPNRFPDSGEQPEYNSVDASLWYAIVVGEFLDAARASGQPSLLENEENLKAAVGAILEGYSRGTRYGIRLDDCGLLACGEPGVQLTWMDAKVGGWVVTPRTGKPVEIQALWLNALNIAAAWDARWRALFEFGLRSFQARFWNPSRRCLHDVIDCFHHRGMLDTSLRPNQIFAVGGLPLNLLPEEQAAALVQTVQECLWTPLGLRSLAPDEMDYIPRYEGGVRQRDGAYHQGTVWPWLAGPFIEAWLRVHGATPEARRQARETFLAPLHAHLREAGLGHVSEIADAEAPHVPRGCPFQAWSLGELLRIEKLLNP
jgi:predicted glycogen debranching enzyme